MVGASGSKKVLAINTDREAPIVAKANYAVFGDLHEIVPAITAEIKKAKGG
jgi:electron transfer flavoprotein alpha subunit